MTDLEKIARAMCVDGGFDPDETVANDGLRWRYYAPLARTALTAIRTPSPAVREAMAKEVFTIFRRDQNRRWDDVTATEREYAGQLATIIWAAAIDAIIGEKGSDHD